MINPILNLWELKIFFYTKIEFVITVNAVQMGLKKTNDSKKNQDNKEN